VVIHDKKEEKAAIIQDDEAVVKVWAEEVAAVKDNLQAIDFKSDKPILAMKNLCKNYQLGTVEVQALRNINLTINEGDYVAIMGPSGSGKSTLLNMIGCLDRPSSGEYFLGGQDVSKLEDDELSLIRGDRIGFVFQSFNLISQLNIIENIEIPMYYQGYSKQQSADRALELAGLVDPKRDTVGGTWQRRGRSLVLTSPAIQNRAVAPIAPAGSYALDAQFVRVSGDDTVCFVLPVGPRSVSLLFSAWHSAVHGLGGIKGRDPRSNPTGVKPGILRNGVTYRAYMTVKVRGERVRITVRVNGDVLIAWEGPLADLSPHGGWVSPRPGQPAFGTSYADAVFRSVRLKMLSGEARVLR